MNKEIIIEIPLTDEFKCDLCKKKFEFIIGDKILNKLTKAKKIYCPDCYKYVVRVNILKPKQRTKIEKLWETIKISI